MWDGEGCVCGVVVCLVCYVWEVFVVGVGLMLRRDWEGKCDSGKSSIGFRRLCFLLEWEGCWVWYGGVDWVGLEGGRGCEVRFVMLIDVEVVIEVIERLCGFCVVWVDEWWVEGKVRCLRLWVRWRRECEWDEWGVVVVICIY